MGAPRGNRNAAGKRSAGRNYFNKKTKGMSKGAKRFMSLSPYRQKKELAAGRKRKKK
jgi:hypothetical protein